MHATQKDTNAYIAFLTLPLQKNQLIPWTVSFLPVQKNNIQYQIPLHFKTQTVHARLDTAIR